MSTESEQSESESVYNELPFSQAKQKALLGHLLVNERFFLQARNKIEPSWFEDKYASKVLAAKLQFYNSFQRIPSDAELREHPILFTEETAVRNKCYLTITAAQHETEFFGLDALAPELTNWLRARLFTQKIERSAKLFNNKKLDAAYAEIKEVTRQIDDIRFENDHEVQFDNYVPFLDSQSVVKKDCLTFGIDLMDKLLLPDGENGSLLRGDTTLLLAPTNIGKTSTMITIIVRNLLLGKSVLFLTHEGRPEDIQEKIWCCILGRTKQELYAMYTEPFGQEIMNKRLLFLTQYLTYIPFNKAGATVEEVEQMIRKKQDERVAKGKGGYDLLVCDYPSKLTTAQAQHGHLQYRHIETYVYNYFVQLALEYKFHSLLAIQTNRTGSKKNRGHKSKWEENGESNRVLVMEDVAESWGPMTIATNVISINRDERAMIDNRLSFHICKSRTTETGWTVVCRTDFSRCRTHGNLTKNGEFGGCYYRSSHTMSEKMSELLRQFDNQAIPTNVISKYSTDGDPV